MFNKDDMENLVIPQIMSLSMHATDFPFKKLTFIFTWNKLKFHVNQDVYNTIYCTLLKGPLLDPPT
jgi:hypothetical protein